MQPIIITNDQELDAAIARMIQLEYEPNPVENPELNALCAAVEAYEEAAGYTPDLPKYPANLLLIEQYKQRYAKPE